MDYQQELKQLNHKIIMSNYKLSYLGQLEELQGKHPNDEVFQTECLSTRAFMLFRNDVQDEAFDIYMHLINSEHLLPGQLPTALSLLLKMLSDRGRNEEAIKLFNKHIYSKDLSFIPQIGLFNWYLKTYNPSESDLASYKSLLEEISSAMGYEPKEAGIRQKAQEIIDVNHRVNRQYMEIEVTWSKQTHQQRRKVILEFIASDPPAFYKNLAVEKLKSLS